MSWYSSIEQVGEPCPFSISASVCLSCQQSPSHFLFWSMFQSLSVSLLVTSGHKFSLHIAVCISLLQSLFHLSCGTCPSHLQGYPNLYQSYMCSMQCPVYQHSIFLLQNATCITLSNKARVALGQEMWCCIPYPAYFCVIFHRILIVHLNDIVSILYSFRLHLHYVLISCHLLSHWN